MDEEEKRHVLSALYYKLKEHVDIVVNYEEFESKTPCVALFSQQGGTYKTNVLGEFNAKIPFLIVYRAYPRRDKQRLKQLMYLSKLGKWICDNPPTVEGITVEKITQKSAPATSYRGADGTTDCSMIFEITVSNY